MPVAQRAGTMLAYRIYERMRGEMSEEEIKRKYNTDYGFIPTTVFTPNEYSYVGLSESEAIEEYGEDDIEVYHR